MRVFTISIALIGCVAAAPLAARAQNVGRPFEFGLDAAAQFGLGDTHFTTIVLPAQRARIGYEFSNKASFEPFAAFIYQSAGGFSSAGLGLGARNIFLPAGNPNGRPRLIAATVFPLLLRSFRVM